MVITFTEFIVLICLVYLLKDDSQAGGCGSGHSIFIHTLFREVLNLIKPIAVVKKLPITLNLAPDLPEFVVGDEKRLMQIILNIVDNAVKFTKQGSISVTALVTKSDTRAPDFFVVPTGSHFYLRVKVKDLGAEINPQELPKIFTKFSQTQSLATRSSGGSGLGLAISKRFVNLMEGNIWIESDGIGKGCTAIFDVKLGISQRSKEFKQSGIQKSPVDTRNVNFAGLKVLVMDENGVSRMVTKRLLVHLGCEVTVVSSNEECLRVVSYEHKVVFMDVCTFACPRSRMAKLLMMIVFMLGMIVKGY